MGAHAAEREFAGIVPLQLPNRLACPLQRQERLIFRAGIGIVAAGRDVELGGVQRGQRQKQQGGEEGVSSAGSHKGVRRWCLVDHGGASLLARISVRRLLLFMAMTRVFCPCVRLT